jgi:VanZ family protein
MAGYSFSGTCYATLAEAHDAYFSGIQPYFNNALGATTINKYYLVKQDGTWFNFYVTINMTTGVETLKFAKAVTYVPSLLTCDTPNDKLTNFLEGQELGWLVAYSIVMVAIIRFIVRR